MVIIPKQKMWKGGLFFLLFVSFLFLSLLFLSVLVSREDTRRVRLFVAALEREVGGNFRENAPKLLLHLTEKLFGPIVGLRVSGGKKGFLHLVDQFWWSSEEKSRILRWEKNLECSLRGTWILSEPRWLSLVVPKIIQFSLSNPHFMQDLGLSFRRGPHFSSIWRNIAHRSVIFYRSTKITEQSYLPMSKSVEDVFLQEIMVTYLHVPISEISAPHIYNLPNSRWWKKSRVLFLYFPSIQAFISVSLPSPELASLWENEPVELVLCLGFALSGTLFVLFFPREFFFRKEK